MTNLSLALIVAIQLVLACVGAGAQERTITRGEFLEYLATSRKLTDDTSFRRSVVIMDSDYPDRDWKPYSSWVVESVFPDRAHLSYKTGRLGDFVRIGKYLYSKEQPGSPWVRSEDNSWVSIPSSPSSIPGFKGPVVEYSIVNIGEAETVIRVLSKPTVVAEDKDTLLYVYSFDNKGVLLKQESVGFNGRRFVLRTENYAYDPSIKIEAPIP